MRDRPLFVLGASQLFVSAAAVAFHLVVRPELLATYAHASVPSATSWALSAWLLPVAACLGAAAALAGVLAFRQRARRLRVMSAGLMVSGLVFTAAVLLAIVPLMRSLK
jgi:hypothetical protein